MMSADLDADALTRFGHAMQFGLGLSAIGMGWARYVEWKGKKMDRAIVRQLRLDNPRLVKRTLTAWTIDRARGAKAAMLVGMRRAKRRLERD